MTTPHEHLTNEHYADLQRSALSDETILRCEFFSAAPFRLNTLPPAWREQVKSAMVIPYFDLAGTRTTFERLKLFPTATDKDGDDVKYWQSAGSEPRLYLPPLVDWRMIATDPSIPLRFSEGEKKSAALTQARYPCLGVAGVWNWRIKQPDDTRLHLLELGLFEWAQRTVEVIPDNDAWRSDKIKHVLPGFYALAVLLQRKGARVRLVRIPA